MRRQANFGFFPEELNRQTAPEALSPSQAQAIQRFDIETEAAARGPGQARPDFTTGDAASIIGCFSFMRRDGTRMLVWVVRDIVTIGNSTAKLQVRPSVTV